jgi:serine/threonine protein phosphatase 1
MNKLNIPKNEFGRDFVCGDLHGSFDRLMAFLRYADFDPAVDRMFSVGDLVDRGPNSLECLDLLNAPWFYIVQGNHEHLMYDFYGRGPYAPFWKQNGGKWGEKYLYTSTEESNKVLALANKASQLPLMLTIDMIDGRKFHVIHAELDAIMQITDEDLDNPSMFNKVAFEQTMDGDTITWGRKLFYHWYCTSITDENIARYKEYYALHNLGVMFNDKLSHIYSGHSIVMQPLTIGGQTNLDTGAYKSYQEDPAIWAGLTVTEPLTGKFWITNAEGTKETTNIVIV